MGATSEAGQRDSGSRPGPRRPVVVVVAVLCLAAGVLAGWLVRGDGAEHAAGGGQMGLSEADILFAQQMSAHHQQALTMVELLGPAAAPEVRAAAEQIRISQWREVGTLTGWLELAGAPLTPPAEQGGGAEGEHGAHDGHTGMAGMASDAELTELYHATGVEAEILFLRLMIRHHQGGADMAADAAAATDSAAVRARAVSMANGQQQELATLSVLLSSRGGEMLPYP